MHWTLLHDLTQAHKRWQYASFSASAPSFPASVLPSIKMHHTSEALLNTSWQFTYLCLTSHYFQLMLNRKLCLPIIEIDVYSDHFFQCKNTAQWKQATTFKNPLWKPVTSVSGGHHFVSHETTQYSALLLKLCNDRLWAQLCHVLYYTGTTLHDDESAFAISWPDHTCSLHVWQPEQSVTCQTSVWKSFAVWNPGTGYSICPYWYVEDCVPPWWRCWIRQCGDGFLWRLATGASSSPCPPQHGLFLWIPWTRLVSFRWNSRMTPFRRLYLLRAGHPQTTFLFLPSWPHGPVQREETQGSRCSILSWL